jgi:hypothetical protein
MNAAGVPAICNQSVEPAHVSGLGRERGGRCHMAVFGDDFPGTLAFAESACPAITSRRFICACRKGLFGAGIVVVGIALEWPFDSKQPRHGFAACSPVR